MLVYVLAVDACAVLVIVLSASLAPVTPSSWLWFAMLAVSSILHQEATRGIERMREIAADGGPYAHFQSTWFFAGVLVLPPPLLAALVAVGAVHEWYAVYRSRATPYRKVFSAATIVLGCAAAVAFFTPFSDGMLPFTALLDRPGGLLALIGAGFLYWLVNYALVVGAIAASNPDRPLSNALGTLSDQLIVSGSIGLGIAVAGVVVHLPWAAPALLLTILAIQLGLLVPQLSATPRTDSKTGLVAPSWWQTIAGRELDRARRLRGTVAVLMLDLDHFKQVNDRYGHLAGDRVLGEVSATIRNSVRDDDLVGRWGGEEFAVLLPGLSTDEVLAVAERIRTRIANLTVTAQDRTNTEVQISDFTVSIGAGVHGETATELGPLLLATDDALLRAKEQGRNRVVIAGRITGQEGPGVR